MADVKFSSETVPQTDFEKIRARLGVEFQRVADVIGASRRPLPTGTGDGSYLHLTPDTPELLKKVEGTLKDMSHLGITDIKTLLEVQNLQRTGAMWDD
jgi:linoleate 8R-lipoxygenase / 9,12-octadecadienoate 8-hydroperoxide 8R-isomerase